jgi:hypothetical protein
MTTTSSLKKLLGLRNKPRGARLVTNSRVACPMGASGDVDIDRCYSCPYFKAALRDDTAGEQWIACSTPRAVSRPTQAQC